MSALPDTDQVTNGKYTLYQGDCFAQFSNIADKSVRLIVCDLPYGVTHNKWDVTLDMDCLWREYKRILVDNGVVALFGQSLFMAKLILSNESMFKYNLIWDKMQTTGHLNANKMPLRVHEEIGVFYNGSPVYNPQMWEGLEPVHGIGKGSLGQKATSPGKTYGDFVRIEKPKTKMKHPVSIIRVHNNLHTKRWHPTQKPIALLRWLINTYSNKNDVVLDNCMGSGSTGVACMVEQRRFIGIELEKKYFDIACKRIGMEYNSLVNMLWV